MADVDQRGFDNQPTDYLAAADAAAVLGVKLATLYAYASRGLVQSVPGERANARRYLRADLEALRARRDARAGHGPVAAGALRFGDPVLESSVASITPSGPRYRGHSAVALAGSDAAFESVAELLWTGADPAAAHARWTADGLAVPVARLASLLPRDAPPASAIALTVAALAAREPGSFDPRPAATTDLGRVLVARMAASLALPRGPAAVTAALRAPTIAGAVALALGARRGAPAVRAVNRALVVCADHELNASTFAARVAASTGAHLYSCVVAALAALSGPLHGGACDRVEALLDEARDEPARAAAVVRARTRRGEAVPGFGHRLYPAGDPRATPLLAAARALAPRDRRVRTAFALVDAMRAARHEAPTLDLGLVALAAALGCHAGAAVAIFAVGRAAGWIAHAIEQQGAGYILRPRARYVGTEA